MQKLTLVLNAAESRLQIVLLRDEESLCAQDWAASKRGTELLAPALEQLFVALRLSFADLAAIACVNGPGSFTGIRLTLSTAAALARASGAQLAGLDYMQALALNARYCRQAQDDRLHVWVLTHARRDLVHARPFLLPSALAQGPCPLPVPLDKLELLPPAECVRRISLDIRNGFAVLGVGSAFARHPEFAGLCPRLLPPDPTPENLALLAAHASYSRQDIEAMYVRPCDAVEKLDQLAQRQGRDPQEMRQRLDSLLTKTF